MRKVDPEKHEERRQQILQAAARCFARDGFRGASISEICAEAGMSAGHLYHYFPNKEAIVSAMTEGGLARAAEHFEQMMQSPDPIRAFIAESTKTKRGLIKESLVFDVLAEAGRNTELADILRRHTLALRALLADFLRKAQVQGRIDAELDAEMTAAILMAIIDGARTMLIRDPKLGKGDSADYLELLVTRFLASQDSGQSV
ncbi:TetR/AcrR family transcriptional regulator [Paraburkholderia susongensis]|uniref:Transcriptional regulator, TetR family n=1 Tax=Paraburkholderia susongensis TaxID=1515439 RepID=A0A1X7LWK7_9BURK|nr:TetR/AcrR family transcriptional regulator [Paraburkholderia susongensis]SMG57894.1 transcriptional regulator, TetR family [Paraburkholderia susongensis]